jgi:hypothetical protein
MKQRITFWIGIFVTFIIASLCSIFSVFSPVNGQQIAATPVKQPFLNTLLQTEGGVTIVYGTGSGSEEAAMYIFKVAKTLPGASKQLRCMKAEEFDASHFRFTGTTNIIAVGTLADNVVLQGRNWLPTWWLDRDWYYTKYKYAVQPDKALQYQPTSGFVASGFGEWAKGDERIGYIEVDRSAYFMEWMVRSRYEEAADGPIKNGNHPAWNKLNTVTTPTYPNDFPLRLIVCITGSGKAGVLAAARAFTEQQLLSGVVMADGAVADSGPTMFTLPSSRYAVKLPFIPPTGTKGFTYQGWLLPSAFEYDGFRHDAGVTPLMMYRMKYKPDSGITNFWTTPHRRASQFEISVVECANAEDAQKAKLNLEQTLANTPGGKEGKITGFNMAVVGKMLLLESLPEPRGKELLEQYKQLFQ